MRLHHFLSAAVTLSVLANPVLASASPISHGSIQIDTSVLQSRNLTLPVAIKGKGCTFYEHADGGGEAWHKGVGWQAQTYANQVSYAEYVTTVGNWWDDRISSLQCDESDKVHCSVAVYPDQNKGGREAIFWGSQGIVNLGDWGYDKTISSYMIFCNLMK